MCIYYCVFTCVFVVYTCVRIHVKDRAQHQMSSLRSFHLKFWCVISLLMWILPACLNCLEDKPQQFLSLWPSNFGITNVISLRLGFAKVLEMEVTPAHFQWAVHSLGHLLSPLSYLQATQREGTTWNC